jgi:CheY-like chemotaxis protein
VDFGLATVNAEEGDDDATQGPRSIDYAGLERVTNVRRNDPRSDLFFLGCMLYQMVSGQPPLKETRERMKRIAPQRFREIPPITAHQANLPHRLVILVNRLMDLNAETRIQTAQQALRETQSVLDAISSGDNEVFDAELSRKQAAEYEALMARQNEGRNRTVLVVDSDAQIQDLFREKLKDVGYRVLIMGNPQRALDRFRQLDPAEELPADCVIFGTVGTGVAAVEAFNQFTGELMTSVPSILLIDPKKKHLRGQANGLADNRQIVELPVKMREIRELLTKLFESVPPRETNA